MPHKPLELPNAVARAFVEDIRSSFAEESPFKRDEIAARQLSALHVYNPPSAKRLRIADVHEMFQAMKDYA